MKDNKTVSIPRIKKSLWSAMLDTLAPQQCVYCDQATHRSAAICDYCEEALQFNDQACPGCALPHCGGSLCPDCQCGHFSFERASAAFVYDRAISLLVAQWKFRGRRHLSHTIAELMLNADPLPTTGELLLATPLHWRRQLQRGFNQSEELLRALVQLKPSLATSMSKTIRLKRQQRATPQAKLSRRNRLENLHGGYSISGRVENLSITLIDDICTTGATANAISETLLEAGAAGVQLWCFARTPAR